MGRLFYIIYRCDFRTTNSAEALIYALQFMIFYGLPITLLRGINQEWTENITGNPLIGWIIFIAIAIFNYFYYQQEKSQKKLLVKYTYKYPFIENNPGLSFILFIFLPTILVLLLTAILLVYFKILLWQ